MTISRRGPVLVALTSVLIGMVIFRRIKTRIDSQSAKTRQRTPALPKLADLPLEILVEVLCLLEWKDILHVRETSKRLRDASIARPVWLRLFQWYSATIQPRPFWPEKPLELHTNRELEYLILKWHSAKARYALAQPKERRFSTSEPEHNSVHLVEGGRWLLFVTENGCVKYYDLNAQCENPEAVILVPSHFNQLTWAVAHLSIDMHADAEYLTFNLGIMTSPFCPVDDDPDLSRWIEVLRVTPHWDENGQVTGLRAERLACFREAYNPSCKSFTLGGNHVAYSMYDLDGQFSNGRNIAVVDWRLPDSASLSYPRRLVCHRQAEWLALVPGDRLLCRYSENIQLFDLKNAPVTTLCPTQYTQRPAQPPLASLELFIKTTSQPYLVDNSIRFAVGNNKKIHGLIVHSGGALECVDLLSLPVHPHSIHITYNRAVVCGGYDTSVLQFAWPEGQSRITPTKTVFAPIGSDIQSDLYSGRIVNCRERSQIIPIFDIPSI